MRILLIDDNKGFTDLLAIGLRAEGFEVTCVNEPSLALTSARVFKPDVIVCDLSMPGMDGWTVARQVRGDETLRGVRLIAATGYKEPNNVSDSNDAGFDVFLEKPFGHTEIAALLNPSLERVLTAT